MHKRNLCVNFSKISLADWVMWYKRYVTRYHVIGPVTLSKVENFMLANLLVTVHAIIRIRTILATISVSDSEIQIRSEGTEGCSGYLWQLMLSSKLSMQVQVPELPINLQNLCTQSFFAIYAFMTSRLYGCHEFYDQILDTGVLVFQLPSCLVESDCGVSWLRPKCEL